MKIQPKLIQGEDGNIYRLTFESSMPDIEVIENPSFRKLAPNSEEFGMVLANLMKQIVNDIVERQAAEGDDAKPQ